MWTKFLTIYIYFSTINFVYISVRKEYVRTKINEDKQNKIIINFGHLQNLCPGFQLCR